MVERFLHAMRTGPLVPLPEVRRPGWFVKAMAKASYRIVFGPMSYLDYRIWCWQEERQSRNRESCHDLNPYLDGGEFAQAVAEVQGT